MKFTPDQHAVTKNLSLVSFATAITRILGYGRDMAIAAVFGGGIVTDAFVAAVGISNLLKGFLIDGATSAFIPVFTDVERKQGANEAQIFLSSTLAGIVCLHLLVFISVQVFSPNFTLLTSAGFAKDPSKLHLTAGLLRLMFASVFFLGLVTLITAILAIKNRFFLGSVSPAILSAIQIVFLLFVAKRFASPIHALALLVSVGALAQFLFLWPLLKNTGYRLSLTKPFAHIETKTLLMRFFPIMATIGALYITVAIDQLCASFLAHGAVTALYYSSRVIDVPLGLFALAAGNVTLPVFSRLAADERHAEFNNVVGHSIKLMNFALIPSMIGLAVLALPIVRLLFEHGQFNLENSRQTASALTMFSLGLPASGIIFVFLAAFSAKKDVRTPAILAFFVVALNTVGNLLLMRRWGVAGIALSTSLCNWFQAVALSLVFRYKFDAIGGRNIGQSFVVGLGIGCLMGGAAWIVCRRLLTVLPLIVGVPIAMLVGAAVYVGAARALAMTELSALWSIFQNRIARSEAGR